MFNAIGMIAVGILIGYIFIKGREFIVRQAKPIVREIGTDIVDITHASIGKSYPTIKKDEPFIWQKFLTGMFSLTSGEKWGTDLVSEFNLRRLFIRIVMISLIVGAIYGYGWYKGKQGQVPVLDMRGKEYHIQLNEHFLHIHKNGTATVEDEDGSILKTIQVKDVPELRRALKPYGFELKPIAVVGYGTSSLDNRSFEGGAGVSILKWYQWHLDSFLTNKGIYLGTSYQLDKIKMENSAIGFGAGKGYRGDNRFILYFRTLF